MYLIAKLLLTLVVVYVLSLVIPLLKYRQIAKKIDLPYLLVPFDSKIYLWLIVSVPLRDWLKNKLPKALYDSVGLTIYGWENFEGTRPFDDLKTKSFLLVDAGHCELWTKDPHIATEILRRPQEFHQYSMTNRFLERFGQSVLTSDGAVWQRHRKVVASVINERISKAVWDESIKQARGILEEVYQKSGQDGNFAETNSMPDSLRKLTIHVLSGAGMGTQKDWHDDDDKPKPGQRQSYISATKMVMTSVAGPIILPLWFLHNYPSFLPGKEYLNKLGDAIEDFPIRTTEMLDEERARLAQNPEDVRSNILSQLVTASRDNEKGVMLTDSDLRGNLFIFTAAGFETTANTLTFAFSMLARHPEWQDWILEEIDSILSSSDEYVDVFPKATRVMAFLLETLRIFPPLIHIVKDTVSEVTIEKPESRLWLPKDTTVYVHVIGLHHEPAVWRNVNLDTDSTSVAVQSQDGLEDEQRFRPSRWINPPGSAHTLFQPPKGSFLPWSAGPRVCPGQKMAQVEFTAAVVTLLRHHRVDPVIPVGMTREDVNKRLDAQIKDRQSIVTLEMKNVYNIDPTDTEKGLRLQFTKRS